MPSTGPSETFETSLFFEKASPWIRGAVVGALMGLGIGNAAIEVKEAFVAEQASVCDDASSTECKTYIEEQKDDVPGALGGLVVSGLMSGLVLTISSKSESQPQRRKKRYYTSLPHN